MIIKYQNERKFMVFEKEIESFVRFKNEIQRRTGTKSELRNSKLAPNWWCTIDLTLSLLNQYTMPLTCHTQGAYGILKCSDMGFIGFYDVFISEKFL